MDIDLIKMLWQTGTVGFTDETLDRMDGREVTHRQHRRSYHERAHYRGAPSLTSTCQMYCPGVGKPKSGRVKCRTTSAQCGVRSHRYATNYYRPP
jgi:hypothetical protein